MMMLSYTYNIIGEPLSHVQEQEYRVRSWTTYKQEKTRYVITLEAQHNDRPKLKGPLSLELIFYQKESWGKKELSSYTRFIECVLHDIAYQDRHKITHITSSRVLVKKDPHTIIIVSEIEKE